MPQAKFFLTALFRKFWKVDGFSASRLPRHRRMRSTAPNTGSGFRRGAALRLAGALAHQALHPGA